MTDTRRATTEKISAKITSFVPLARKPKATRLCYENGIATIEELTEPKRVLKVKGPIPRTGRYLTFRFTYFKSDTGTAIKNLLSYDLPPVNRRSIKLNFPILADAMRDNVARMGELNNAPKHLYISMMCLVYPDEAKAAVIEFDHTHNTRYLIQLEYFFACILRLEDMPQWLELYKYGKTVIVAQLLSFMETLFGVDFYSLALISITDLMRVFTNIQKISPVAALREEICFHFDKDGFPPGTQKPAADNSYTVATAGGEEEEEDMLVEEVRKVELKITYKRALDMYKKQLAEGFDFDDEREDDMADHIGGGDDDQDEQLDEDQRNARQQLHRDLASMFMSASAAAAAEAERKKPSTAASIPVKVRDGSATFVAMSTDYRTTKILPLDMRVLTDDDWLNLFITEEVFKKQYLTNRHFCLPGGVVVESVHEESESARGDFPVEEVTMEKLEAVIIRMMIMRKVVAYDTKTLKEVKHNVLATGDEYKDKFFLVDFPQLMFGLKCIVDIEVGIAADLHEFVGNRIKLAMLIPPSLNINFQQLSSWSDGKGGVTRVTLCEEQKRAIVLAATMPLALINGAGGTGKSMIMRLIYMVLRELYPEGHILFTAFKNDTVNQMREAITLQGSVEDARCHFRTTDSFNVTGGVLDYMMTKEQLDSSGGERTRHPIKVCIIEEASMLSSGHIRKLIHTLVSSNSASALKSKTDGPRGKQGESELERLIFFGDCDQLEPINPGSPFADLIEQLPSPRMRLVVNYRTRVEKLTAFLDGLRKRDLSCTAPRLFDDEHRQFDTGSNFLIKDLPECDNRSDHSVMIGYAERLLWLLKHIDPDRRKHDDIIAVCPYNNMADLMSMCFSMYYFEGYEPKEPAFMLAQSKALGKRKSSSMYGSGDDDDDDDDEDESAPPLLQRPAGNKRGKWTLEDALAYAMTREDAKRMMIAGRAAPPPTIYVGMDVAVTKTDRERKEIAAGRVGRVTHIVDHMDGIDIKNEWLRRDVDTRQFLPAGVQLHDNTEMPVPQIKGRVMRTLVLDFKTQVHFAYGKGIHFTLRPSKCRTVHKTQGSQANICIGIYPPGKLATAKILYTGASRSQQQCFTMANVDTLKAMITRESEKCHSLLGSLLAGDAKMKENLAKFRDIADKYYTFVEQTQGLDVEDLVGDDDDIVDVDDEEVKIEDDTDVLAEDSE